MKPSGTQTNHLQSALLLLYPVMRTMERAGLKTQLGSKLAITDPHFSDLLRVPSLTSFLFSQHQPCSQGFHGLAAQVQGEQTACLPAPAVTCWTLSLTLVAAKKTWSPAFLMSPQPQMPGSLSSTQKCQVSKFYQQEVIVSFEGT